MYRVGRPKVTPLSTLRNIARAFARTAGLGIGEIEVRHETLELPRWPETLAGLRVAIVADLHAGSPQIDERRIADVVTLVNREAPDLVALLGDYIDPEVALGDWIEPEAIAFRLARARSRLGTIAVLGNHDWGHTGHRMGCALREAGITLLENDALEVGGLWVAGLGDLQKRTANIDAALAQVPPGAPLLLLSHNPDVFPRVPDRVALTLSGHTHGAQVDIPILRDRLTPSRFGARYTGGHIVEGDRHLFVSDGIGASRLPIRFRAKPVLPVVELQPWTSDSHS